MDKTLIHGIGNYYGSLHVMSIDGAYYWIIENYDTDFDDISQWTEISKSLYDELIKNNRKYE